MNDEIKRTIIDKGNYSENDYPFSNKPNFNTTASILQIQAQGPIFSFLLEDSIRKLLGFHETIFYKKFNLSRNPVDILSFDKNFIECDIAQGMIFRQKRSGFIHNLTMDVDPCYKYFEKFRGGVQWYMMETKDFVSSINFKIKNENNELVSFHGQTITFRLSIKEI